MLSDSIDLYKFIVNENSIFIFYILGVLGLVQTLLVQTLLVLQ